MRYSGRVVTWAVMGLIASLLFAPITPAHADSGDPPGSPPESLNQALPQPYVPPLNAPPPAGQESGDWAGVAER